MTERSYRLLLPYLRTTTAIVLLITGIVGCSKQETILQAKTKDGSTVGDYLSGKNEQVVLILDPAECFTCYRGVTIWKAWVAHPARSMTLLLTRSPGTSERKAMRLAGVQEDGILDGPVALRTPIQLFSARDAHVQIVERASERDAFLIVSPATGQP